MQMSVNRQSKDSQIHCSTKIFHMNRKSNSDITRQSGARKTIDILNEFIQNISFRTFWFRRFNIRENQFYSKNFDNVLMPIGRHGLTAGWLFDSMKEFLNSDLIQNVKCEEIASDGFVSQIIRVYISLINNQKKRIIVKMPETKKIKEALEETTQSKIPDGGDEQFIGGLSVFFNREVDFYSMERVPDLRVPQCYCLQKWIPGKQIGAIVMQDLKDMVNVPFYKSLTLKQVSSIGSQLMNLHLFSIDADQKWHQKFLFPMEIIDTVSNMFDIVNLYVSRNPQLKTIFNKVSKMYKDRNLFIELLRDSHKSLGIDDFLSHGDLWFYNLMWLPITSESSTASNHVGAIIDWQNIHFGSIAEDFGHLLTFCCDTETRRRAENEYLPFYYNLLCRKAKDSGKNLKLTLNQFLRAYRRNFIAHALHLPFISSIMLCVQPSEDPEVQDLRKKELVEKVIGAWEDALQAMREEYPEYDL